ncbi:hypothetical protein CGI04_13725 [Vibrio parahaemolyticus]|uniref:hypothetical protein n=1 Tax=Vibrio parahaemolyticus TaxID=670 RepID=UPI001124BCC5|nr:hypothetical protein [Vibrio parahaemolyticus]TOL18135.1 hypothetical protein CGI04_13725 [Vibrio parahaemolyticus]
MEDEDKMIKKLVEHRDAKLFIIEVGKLHDIDVTSTVDGDPKGDFKYPKEKEEQLIAAIDKYLGKYKYIGSEDE